MPGFGRARRRRKRATRSRATRTSSARSMLNELRVGWMRVRGGQLSLNQGVDFAGPVGLQGVTTRSARRRLPADLHRRALYSTFGDPTSFVYRDNQHFELYDNVHARSRRAIASSSAATTSTCSSGRSSRTTRAARSPTPGSSPATPSPISCSAIRLPPSSGIGRGDEDGRTNWLHLYAQDDWRVRDNLTFNLGLRYEYNQHMRDADNRLSSVDLSVPGGRFVIASDEDGSINPEAQALLPLIPIPYVTSEEAGWDRGLLSPSYVRLAPRAAFALVAATTRGRRPRRLRHLPQSVGLQRADGLRAQPAVLLHQAGRRRRDARVPAFHDANILTGDSDRAGRRQHHGPRLRGRIHADVERRPAVRDCARRRWSKRPTWDRGRSARTTRRSATCPSPGPGSIQARRPIPAARPRSARSASTASRSTTA